MDAVAVVAVCGTIFTIVIGLGKGISWIVGNLGDLKGSLSVVKESLANLNKSVEEQTRTNMDLRQLIIDIRERQSLTEQRLNALEKQEETNTDRLNRLEGVVPHEG